MHSREHAWVEVNLSAIKKNVSLLRDVIQRPVLVMVKANAYGHGITPVAHAAVTAGASMLGVATVNEGIQLRESGIVAPILVMGCVTPDETQDALYGQLQWTVWTEGQISHYSDVACRLGANAQLHIEVDIGMSRFGALPEHVPELLRVASNKPCIEITGLAGHFPSSDLADPGSTIAQNRIFEELLRQVTLKGMRPKLVHAANSAAAIRFPETRYDMVRMGIMVYGVSPFDDTHLPINLIPALSWKTKLLHIKTLKPNSDVGYGGEYVSIKEQRIGVIGVGYSYGFRRTPKNCNQVLIRGKRVAVLGRLCMQQCMINLDEVPQAEVGDEIVLLGRQGDDEIGADELADRWGTNRWDVLCGISPLLPREYSS